MRDFWEELDPPLRAILIVIIFFALYMGWQLIRWGLR